MTPWERYFLIGRRVGCPKDQMDRFQAADVVFQQRQLAASAAARLCDRAEPNVGLAEGGVKPTLFIHKRCGRLLETLPSLQHDPNRPEDVLKIDADEDGIGGDDAADALRYLVATKSRAVTQRKLRGL